MIKLLIHTVKKEPVRFSLLIELFLETFLAISEIGIVGRKFLNKCSNGRLHLSAIPKGILQTAHFLNFHFT
ncbi:hypothetical protein AAHA92_04429 [Salvia divinorum]|uniref:Uncharacterized protein n=1 Tax=Salvia divinorum TaxID=28513 RepID=A0ABD1HZ55_SALDI